MAVVGRPSLLRWLSALVIANASAAGYYNNRNYQPECTPLRMFDVAEVLTYTGADQCLTIPTGCTGLSIKMWGAGGGGNVGGGVGGGGGYSISTSIPVIPGQSYNFVVGGGGLYNVSTAAYGGGGIGPSSGFYYANGGGRSALSYRGNDLITAGGGGGASYQRSGGGGGGTAGATGETGTCTDTGPGAGGGSASAAGTSYYYNYNNDPYNWYHNPALFGSLYKGSGVVSGCGISLATGGGGLWGGGSIGGCCSGLDSGGGGGGSGWAPLGSTTAATGQNAANNSDTDYADEAGKGGGYAASGKPGLIVVQCLGTPAPLSFGYIADAALASTQTSTTAAVRGGTGPYTATPNDSLISLNGGGFSSSASGIVSNDVLQLRTTTPSFYSTNTQISVTLGITKGKWTVATGAGPWAWMQGTSSTYQNGTWGTQGIGSTSNTPSARNMSNTWSTADGLLWLFGGSGYDPTWTGGPLSDLWTFDPATSKWTWIGGPKTVNSAGTYGTQGSPSTSNWPGGRYGFGTARDAAGNLWLFGGSGYDSAGTLGTLNDLWKFNTSTRQWTWVAGSNLVNQSGAYGTKGTSSPSNHPGARNADMVADPSGNLWIFGGNGYDSNGWSSYLNDLWKFNTTTLEWTWMSGSSTIGGQGTWGTKGTASTSNVPSARGYLKTAADNTGQIWIFGGSGYDSTMNSGYLSDLWKFNPSDSKWTWVGGPSLSEQRGTYGTRLIEASSNAPGGRQSPALRFDASNNLWLAAGNGYASTGSVDSLSDVWRFNTTTNNWAWLAGVTTIDGYGTYGTKGTPSTSNVMGARAYFTSWMDPTDGFWFFGGTAYTDVGYGWASDLWVYQPNSFEFTAQTNKWTSMTLTSAAFTLTGVTNATATCGRGCTAIARNGGSFGAGPVTGFNTGDTIQIQQLSSDSLSAASRAVVKLGNYTGVFMGKTMTSDSCSGSPSVGTTCADGTTYVGTTPDTSIPLYAATCDYGMAWNGSSCANTRSALNFSSGTSVATGVTSTVTGYANTAALVAVNGNADGPYAAAAACDGDTSSGRTDWYLPSKDELHALYSASITQTSSGSTYWSSTEASSSTAAREVLSTGSQSNSSKSGTSYVRCVRKEAAPSFSFVNKIGTEFVNSTITSAAITLSGFNGSLPAICGTNCTGILINGAQMGTSTRVSSGNTIAIQQLSSVTALTSTTAYVSVSSTVSSPWIVGTNSNEPGAFGFNNMGSAPAGVTVTSNTVTLTGFMDIPAVCGPGCTNIKINGTLMGTSTRISNGQTIALQTLTSVSVPATTVASVTVGIRRSNIWSVTTGYSDVLTSGTSYNVVPRAGYTQVKVWLIGGGGGGAGAPAWDSYAGGGGGAGGLVYYTTSIGAGFTITYSLGAGGAGGVDWGGGTNGGNSTATVSGASLTATGGYGGTTYSGNGSGGWYSGGNFTGANGGDGLGVTGDTGGGAGGAVGTVNAVTGGQAGGVGAVAADVSGYESVVNSNGYSLTGGGTAGGSGSSSPNAMNAGHATGFGAGGGGAGWFGGNGGNGKYGGGGGGAAGYSLGNLAGGAGGDGVMIIEYQP